MTDDPALNTAINAALLNRSAEYRDLLRRAVRHLEATDCGTGKLAWDIRQALSGANR